MVEALTFGGLVSALASKACRLLLVTDLEARPPTQAERLMAVLSLTRAEAEFCVQFASGSTLSEVSEFLKITQGTARQRLKAIFQKTETNRQSELLLLIARIGGQPR
jgi:DNA-binding CsgD family transcriptional regulator